MEYYLTILIRTLLLYFLIVFIFRVMGKREIGELSILDLVVFIMIAEMAVTAIEDPKDPLVHTVIPMLILMIIQISLAYISLKNQKIRHLLDGKPTIIINQGKVDEHAMRTQRYNFDDLMTQLRDKDINNVADVEFAILEPSGKLSVIEKQNKSKKQTELQLPLIVDGIIQENNLDIIQKNNLWLRQQLKKLGYKEMKQISLCTFGNGVFFIDLKDEDKN
ncbi:DUF421 domain-containing protein [Metabacillus halosaccharovorans]|uniref:DUF421 domain-containing protein n=1 Tax=Metabacillus halosaccharovorans TaxID=930124 RepID=A0ABT3DE57_9BACI|nr:DUF421 domain-containing protein [Metabacillus halosaccharovorans]MCM3441999.1 DUF421 domain-containing protein [Metabacillus halosaccharovorans]MCV9885249.1 DUF421 domain-containing protein [Metabacillus halosaccharovorans]